jgi:choline-sulfatase
MSPDEAERARANNPKEHQALDWALQRPEGVSEADFFARWCPPLPENFAVQDDEPEAVHTLLKERGFRDWIRRHWSEARWREHRWAYARLVASVDAQIGRVLEALDAGPAAENTVVIFTSDHGDMDAAHRLEHKSLFHEESARVPLLVRDPAVPGGEVDRTSLVSNGLDLMPTLCDYAGAAGPAAPEGRSFRPSAGQRPRADEREAVKMESYIGRAVITERHKYMRYDQGAHAEQLYDLEQDPGETRNALHDAHQQEALKRHRRLFDEIGTDGP